MDIDADNLTLTDQNLNCDDLPSTSKQSKQEIWNNLKQKRREENLARRNRTILQRALDRINEKKRHPKRKSKKQSKKRSKKKRGQKLLNKKNSFQILANRVNISCDEENFNLNHRSNAKKNMVEDDDDCICIEPDIEEIVIDDADASDDELRSEYQNLLISFRQKPTSTPLQKGPQKMSTQTFPQSKNLNLIECLENDASPFFEDIAGDLVFTPPLIYKTLSVLTEESKEKRNTESLKDHEAKLTNNNTIASPITILDDSSVKDKTDDSTLKVREPSVSEDDSVIFVSETNKNDFLPLTTASGSNLIEAQRERTPKRTLLPELFTRSEKKELSKYNSNAYNPGGGTENGRLSKKRMIIIDGSNVAFGHALCKNFSVRGLKIAIEYFEKMGHEVKAIVPQFRISKNKSTEPDELERLHRAGKIVLTPCKNLPGKASACYDDRFILQLACELDAVIISNDNYRDLLFENTAFKKIIENRVIGYTWCNDIFILPKDPYGKWGPPLCSILNRV
ncbi:uncharacterized protein ACN427_001671 isoform 1-T1 [Glossina fuscipes fuscipes]